KIPYMPHIPEVAGDLSIDGADIPEQMDPSAMADQHAPEASDLMEDRLASEQLAQEPIEMPTVTLDEIADIKITKNVESISRTNGEESIGVQIVKAPDANTVDVVNHVKESIEKMEKDYGFTAVSTFDQGEPIEDSVNMMLEKAIFGIIFAVIVILLFLRNFRTTLISVVSIPLSLLIALFLLHQMDVTLNILTLGALTVAIGRVIDDSIVVMENIYRRMSLENEKLRGK